MAGTGSVVSVTVLSLTEPVAVTDEPVCCWPLLISELMPDKPEFKRLQPDKNVKITIMAPVNINILKILVLVILNDGNFNKKQPEQFYNFIFLVLKMKVKKITLFLTKSAIMIILKI